MVNVWYHRLIVQVALVYRLETSMGSYYRLNASSIDAQWRTSRRIWGKNVCPARVAKNLVRSMGAQCVFPVSETRWLGMRWEPSELCVQQGWSAIGKTQRRAPVSGRRTKGAGHQVTGCRAHRAHRGRSNQPPSPSACLVRQDRLPSVVERRGVCCVRREGFRRRRGLKSVRNAPPARLVTRARKAKVARSVMRWNRNVMIPRFKE